MGGMLGRKARKYDCRSETATVDAPSPAPALKNLDVTESAPKSRVQQHNETSQASFPMEKVRGDSALAKEDSGGPDFDSEVTPTPCGSSSLKREREDLNFHWPLKRIRC